ncbi:MAG: hypothetical protein ABI402_17940 [Ferruginibacter sp.]
MKHIKLFSAIIISACLLFSCSGNNNNAASDSGSSASASNANAVKDGGSFSALINGVKISGGATDEMQIPNEAFIYAAGSLPKFKTETVFFTLVPDKTDENYYSLKFIFPDKAGTYNKTKNSSDCDCALVIDLFPGDHTGRLATYLEDSITTTINSISASRVTGTFSGKFSVRLSDGLGKNQQPILMVTNGKFDIPFSTGKVRPQ